MFRKINFKTKEYNKNNISITRVKYIDEEESIGDWDKYYPNLKLIYNLDQEVNQRYTYLIKYKRIILGYFIATDIINEETSFIDKCERKMVLLDFGIYSRSYAKYGKLLLNFLIKFARNCFCKALEIKIVDRFTSFYEFLKRHYKVNEMDGSYYILIDNPKCYPNENNLKINSSDSISLENLYFLYGLNFKIYKNVCVYRNKDYKIIVDRRTSLITLPKNVICNKEILLNDKTRNLIYLLCMMYSNNEVEDIYIPKKNTEEVIYRDNLVVFSSFNLLERDYAFLNRKYIEGFNYIHACFIDFDYNHLNYNGYFKIDIKKYLKNKTRFLDMNHLSLREIFERLKIVENFNYELENIKKFEFEMGNSFSGIKKFTILFDDEVLIKHNGIKKENKDLVIDKERIIDNLKMMSFINWKDKYIKEDNPNYDNVWHISLVFEDRVIKYEGLDDYPNVWIFFIEFIYKYSSINLRDNCN